MPQQRQRVGRSFLGPILRIIRLEGNSAKMYGTYVIVMAVETSQHPPVCSLLLLFALLSSPLVLVCSQYGKNWSLHLPVEYCVSDIFRSVCKPAIRALPMFDRSRKASRYRMHNIGTSNISSRHRTLRSRTRSSFSESHKAGSSASDWGSLRTSEAVESSKALFVSSIAQLYFVQL